MTDIRTHIVPCNAEAVSKRHHQFRALCGAVVEEWQHVSDGKPTCEDCARIDAQDAKDLAAMQAYDEESEAEAGR